MVISVDFDGLVDAAARHACVIRMLPAVGDFVAQRSPVFQVFGDGEVPSVEFLDHVFMGRERTMYQDPAFGFRQLVDIAERALSPAINDPTTAVQAIDRLLDLLSRLGPRPIPSGLHVDDDGQLRLIRPVIGWDTFVTLAFEEIRRYGAGSVQVNRRLRAAADQLLHQVTPDRRVPIQRELRLLDREAARQFPDLEELGFAIGSDSAGIGGDLGSER